MNEDEPTYGIEYPVKHSEGEIQALLWYFLRKDKIDARLQVTAFSCRTMKRSNKLDMVIFVGKVAKCIVECKSWTDGYERTAIYRTNNSQQIKKYKETYNLPVLVCARMSYVTTCVEKIKEIIKWERYHPKTA